MEDFCSRIWMTYRSNFTPIGKHDSVVASLESAWQDSESEQQLSRQSVPAFADRVHAASWCLPRPILQELMNRQCSRPSCSVAPAA